MIRLVLENNLRLPLLSIFRTATGETEEDHAQELLDFFADRLKVHLKEKGVRHDLVSAVFALGSEDDLVRLMAQVDALGGFLATEDGKHLLIAYKRAANILRIEEKKDGTSYASKPEATLFAEDQEHALYNAIEDANNRTVGALEQEEYEDAMAIMSGLRHVVDAFFDQVTVNAEDMALRRNRLNLLSEIRDSLDRIADFSKIEG